MKASKRAAWDAAAELLSYNLNSTQTQELANNQKAVATSGPMVSDAQER